MANKTLFALMFLCSYALVPCIFCLASVIWHRVSSMQYRASSIKNRESWCPRHHLYNCKEFFTNQLFIMQNEPNFRKSQMNVNKVLTKVYEYKSNWTLGENEPKTNPIKANLNPIKANIMPIQSQTNPTCSELACPERSRRGRTYFKPVSGQDSVKNQEDLLK